MRARLLVDLDDCLIRLEQGRAYRQTAEGRNFVAKTSNDLETCEPNPALSSIVRDYHARSEAMIVTNAPLGYARGLLARHTFPNDLPIIAAAKKPDTARIAAHITPRTVIIGDSASDILAAHGVARPAIALEGGYSSAAQLQMAEPSAQLPSSDDLETVLNRLEEEGLSYQPRKSPESYRFYTPRQDAPLTEIDIGRYIPQEREQLVCEGAWDLLDARAWRRLIFDYKAARDYTRDELIENRPLQFFYRGQIRHGRRLRELITTISNHAKRRIGEIGCEGTLIAMPNAQPWFCYRTDMNRLLTQILAESDGLTTTTERFIERIYPKIPEHTGGARSEQEHYATMGVRTDAQSIMGPIILVDDVRTSGAQARASAAILHAAGNPGPFYSLALAKTV